MTKTITDDKPRIHFDCTKCPAFCCSIYERVQVTKRDISRLAKHFGVTVESAIKRYTKMHSGERVLRRTHDELFDADACMFLDREKRGCTIYHARPAICREYPARSRCSYYDVLRFERQQQDDENVLPLFQITFRQAKKDVQRDDKGEKVWKWEEGKGGRRKAKG
ncbi:MAG: YkgJ family cysteine cluster protein [Pyrinomonadaceae bacterium]|nr:YkgJ family cysteine cluster protein [Pyrinomonadaceae bacterium]